MSVKIGARPARPRRPTSGHSPFQLRVRATSKIETKGIGFPAAGGSSPVDLARLPFAVAWVGFVSTILLLDPNAAAAAACGGQNTATVICNGVNTANNTERATTNSTPTTVTITGANRGFGIAAVMSGTVGTALTATNTGSVVLNNPGAIFAGLSALRLTGNGGLITYSGSGNVSNNLITTPPSPGLTITNTANGGGGINANTGTGSIAGDDALVLTTAGAGAINLTTGGRDYQQPGRFRHQHHNGQWAQYGERGRWRHSSTRLRHCGRVRR